jgi:hypothetical protein
MNQQEQLSHIKILAQIQLNYLTDFKAENKSFFTGSFKNFCNNFINHLIQIENKYFDKAIDKEEKSVTEIYKIMDAFLKDVSKVPVWEMQNISTIINAYKKDPKSIEGICKKILN